MKRDQLTQTNHIHHQHPVLQRHEAEVHRLHRRPQHPVLLERLPVRAPHLVARVRPLHERHGREEAEEVRRGEDGLVRQDARGDGQVGGRGEVDAAGEEGEPGCGGGAEDGCFGGKKGGVLLVGWLVERGVGRRKLNGEGGKGGGIYTAAVESHSACAGEVVLGGADFLNALLGHDIAGCEEYLFPQKTPPRSVPYMARGNADWFVYGFVRYTYGCGDALGE